jgi:hypothetical protein
MSLKDIAPEGLPEVAPTAAPKHKHAIAIQGQTFSSFRQWNHGEAPCFLCDVKLGGLYDFVTGNIGSDLTDADYNAEIRKSSKAPLKTRKLSH